MSGNIGVGGVVTGRPGSSRRPRILAAPRTTIPATTPVSLPAARYVNEGPGPLFVEEMHFDMLESTAASAAATVTAAAQILSKINVGKLDFVRTFTPWVAFAEFGPSLGNGFASGVWRFQRPFMLRAGEGFSIDVQNAGAASVVVAVSAHGYRESMPERQDVRYVPCVLHDQVSVGTSGTAALNDEALKNAGDYPLHCDALSLSAFSFDADSALMPLANVLAKITTHKGDVMISREESAALIALSDTTTTEGLRKSPIPLPGDYVLDPTGGFSGEIENTNTELVARVDVAIIGFKEVQL